MRGASLPQCLQPCTIDQGAQCGAYAESHSRQRGPEEAEAKANEVIAKLKALRLGKASELVVAAITETFDYFAFPGQHWIELKTNNPLETLTREIRRRTRVVGAFPDTQSCLSIAAARLTHIAGTKWSTQRHINMDLLKQMETDTRAATA